MQSVPYFLNSLTIFTLLYFNHLNTQLNPICHLLALLGAHHILHVSRIRVNFTIAHLCYKQPSSSFSFLNTSPKMASQSRNLQQVYLTLYIIICHCRAAAVTHMVTHRLITLILNNLNLRPEMENVTGCGSFMIIMCHKIQGYSE